jgi:hypothetical protein
MEISFVLKEAQMSPGFVAGVVCSTEFPANRAAKSAAAWKVYLDIKPALLNIKRAADDTPRVCEAKRHLEKLNLVHLGIFLKFVLAQC